MGLTRVYLAFCVVAAHSTSVFPWTMHSGAEAVQIFFMISGFYMALIGEKYASTTEFLASRFLRIYVPYYLVLGGILAVSVLCGLITGKWLALDCYRTWTSGQNGLGGVAIATFGNCFVFLSDWTIFISHEPNSSLAFTSNFHQLSSPLPVYLFNPLHGVLRSS